MSCVADQGFEQGGARAGSVRVLVAGATGFAGALAAYLLWRHPHFQLVAVTGRSEVGRTLNELYPRYRVPLEIEELDLERHAPIGADPDLALDAAVVAYPHAAAAPTVGALVERGVRVINLSADFRLTSLASYQPWYGEHPRPDLLSEAAYGLSELHRARIAAARIVANPGCYPTAAVLGLAPLARAGLIANVVIDASGDLGRRARVRRDHASVDRRREHPALQGRLPSPHSEIEEQLYRFRYRPPELTVQFQAHLVPLDQGEPPAATSPRPARSPRRSCASCTPTPTPASRSSKCSMFRPARVTCTRRTSVACSQPPTLTPASWSCSRRSTTCGRAPRHRPSRT